MTTPAPVYTELPRDEVTVALGPYWPVPASAPHLVLPPDAPLVDGAVAVYPRPGRPGVTWWALDAAIPPQPSGTPDEALAALLPGSALVLPDPPPDIPPSPPLTD